MLIRLDILSQLFDSHMTYIFWPIFLKDVNNYIMTSAWTALSSHFIINAESLKRVEVRCEHVVEGRHLHQFSVHSVVVRSRRTPWHDILSRPPRRHFQSLIFNPQNIKNAKYSLKIHNKRAWFGKGPIWKEIKRKFKRMIVSSNFLRYQEARKLLFLFPFFIGKI